MTNKKYKKYYKEMKRKLKGKKIYLKKIGSYDPFGNDHDYDEYYVYEDGTEISDEDYWYYVKNWDN